MLRKLGEKLGVVNYVRGLFAARNETLRATRWNCVLRDGRLLVVRAFFKQPADVLIMTALLDCDRLPSWYETYVAVSRNWQLLAKANVSP
jgi:hypothetical protein